MSRLLTLLLLVFSIAACKDAKPTEPASPDARPKMTEAEKMAKLAPPPPECEMLTKEEVASVFPVPVNFPLPGQRSVSSFYSCQYDVDGDKWTGQVAVDFPRDPRKRQSVIDEVAGAEGADAVEVSGNSARFLNDNTLSVSGGKPFRIFFKASNRNTITQVWTSDEYREILLKLAAAATP